MTDQNGGFGGVAVAWVAFGVMALAQIAIPLTDHDPTIEWLSSLVVAAFFATTLALAIAHWGLRRAALGCAFVVVATLVVERIGTTTGFPFGAYDYTGALEPTVAGVPLIVPLAWFAMGVPALEVGRRISGSRPVAVVAGAAALAAWDLFLDPQMVDAGYWRWHAGGAYQDIPLSNYAGWFGLGLVVIGVLDRIRGDALPAGTSLVALYTWWAVMDTVGFVVFFDRPLVGLVGGIGMGTLTALAWRPRPSTAPVRVGAERG